MVKEESDKKHIYFSIYSVIYSSFYRFASHFDICNSDIYQVLHLGIGFD